MNGERTTFGSVEGKEVDLFVLSNQNGMKVKVTTYGATITSIILPDKNGDTVDIVCGFDTLEGYQTTEYKSNAPYFGCTVGRYASRIKNGKFQLGAAQYDLINNDGPNHLHGGKTGFDKRIWSASSIEGEGSVGVRMELFSPHLEEGYPGNVNVSVEFRLTPENAIIIDYAGSTDQVTPLSLTNHSYFNLSGFTETIENHTALVAASHHLKPDTTNVPIGEIESLKNLPCDLSIGKRFKDVFNKLATGFEHYFIFDKPLWELEKVAEFSEPDSNRKLEVFTSEPGMLFYSGYFTSDKLQRENGDQYGKFRGFCCETHRYPNGPNIAGSPGSLTTPEQPYKSQTIFKLSW